MASAAKYWPSRLFGRKASSEPETGFKPTTELAARIVGKPIVGTQRSPDDTTTRESLPEFADLELEFAGEPGTPANDLVASRQSQRFVPVRAATALTDSRGKQIRARIINLSATGVAVEADFRAMPPDTITMVGSKTVRTGRPIRGGHVFVFDKPLDAARCNPQIVL